MGSCNMKLAGIEEFWVLNWQCMDVAINQVHQIVQDKLLVVQEDLME